MTRDLTHDDKVAMLAEAISQTVGMTWKHAARRLLADPRIGAAISKALDEVGPEPDPVEEALRDTARRLAVELWGEGMETWVAAEADPKTVGGHILPFLRAEVAAGRLTIGAPE